MPSSARHNQPVARKKARRGGAIQACSAGGLRDTLEHIAAQLGDADKRHGNTLAEIQDRLSLLGHKVDDVRAGLPGEIAHPSQRGWNAGASSRTVSRTSMRPSTGAEADEPWDTATAEALTRVYEKAQLHRPASPPRQTRQTKAEVPAPAPAQPAWQGTEPDRVWLEARLSGIDSLLQQALAGVDPDKSLDAVRGRLDQFEARFEEALETVARRSDLEGLTLLEQQVTKLSRQFEETRDQLGRLDAIDQSLRDLALGSSGEKRASDIDSKAVASMIDAAADRAATRLAEAASSSGSAGAGKRVEALEELLQDYIEERRRGEEVTAGILRTIEDALARIVDRVDAIDMARPAPAAAQQDQEPAPADGLEIESERLAQAYAAGARVLGQRRAERSASGLDAADYTSFAPLSLARATADDPAADSLPDEKSGTCGEPRSPELRTRMTPHAKTAPGYQPRTDAAGPEAAGSSAGSNRARLSSVLAIIILLLFGTSYMLVDSLLSQGPESVTAQPTEPARAAIEPGAASADSGFATGRTAAPSSADVTKSAPADQRSSGGNFMPRPKLPQSGPEAATDDLTQVEADASWRNSAMDGAGQKIVAAFPATTVATAPNAGIDPMGQDRTLLGRDHPRLLPTAIGPAALRNAAANGDADAAFEVGTRFAEGKGVAQDLKQAFAWYQRAAAHGHASAQFRVAAFHERGIAGAPDRERALLWYRRAAEQGHVKAMHNLAVLMVGKVSDRVDYASAARWFREAAERGLADSQYNLAILCEDGHGVARSLPEAYKWFALAARSGDRGAAHRLAQVKARLDASELTAAEEMVAVWHVREPGAPVEAAAADAAAPTKVGE
jgi:localization factor PodJL